MTCSASCSSASCTSVSATASSISSFERTSSAKKSVSSSSAPCLRADQAEVLLAPEHELADRRHPRLLHRPQKEDVRLPLRLGVGGREVVGAVEVDGIDVLEPDEAEDRDRLRARQRNGLEIGLLDEDVLALRELPALDELVGLDVALVHRAPALLLDRRAALPMQGAERDVLPLGREREPDGDVDEAEADRSVPDGAHGEVPV